MLWNNDELCNNRSIMVSVISGNALLNKRIHLIFLLFGQFRNYPPVLPFSPPRFINSPCSSKHFADFDYLRLNVAPEVHALAVHRVKRRFPHPQFKEFQKLFPGLIAEKASFLVFYDKKNPCFAKRLC